MRSNWLFSSFMANYEKNDNTNRNYYKKYIDWPKIRNRPGDNIIKPFNNWKDHIFHTITFSKNPYRKYDFYLATN